MTPIGRYIEHDMAVNDFIMKFNDLYDIYCESYAAYNCIESSTTQNPDPAVIFMLRKNMLTYFQTRQIAIKHTLCVHEPRLIPKFTNAKL